MERQSVPSTQEMRRGPEGSPPSGGGTLSFSLYSSGFTIEAKREAIEKLAYPSL
jgi:hypothetical protein